MNPIRKVSVQEKSDNYRSFYKALMSTLSHGQQMFEAMFVLQKGFLSLEKLFLVPILQRGANSMQVIVLMH